ncbi:Ribokinase [Polystyrenella longa]|uniref:Ribokinase n=2 Tax=Polystyrenella longa TaxID=2528007 RepID=A0A518CP16_9PLAN|nr:Ribokinase [Polystyrenella longa]
MNPTFKIVGLGEILWDIFPDGERLGGAPSNFACHCRQLGSDAFPVSCVGADELGQRTRTELKQLDVSPDYIQENESHSTGKVMVTLNDEGKPTYEILEDMAWDYLTFTPEWKALAQSLDAVCFGSLAQRSPQSRETIRTFLQHMPEKSLKIFDVNLREPFFGKEVVEESLELATILKLSDEELPVLAEYFNLAGTVTEQLSALRERFNLNLIAYTRGSDGSILSSVEETNESCGVKVKAIDSVGAGDSFTAALCTGLLKKRPLAEVNTFANQVAAYVCSNKGACPTLPDDLKSF